MTEKEIPILLLTGYLGSGKTTLLNHLLCNSDGLRCAVIVNDIGEVNIDASLIQRNGIVKQKDSSLVALENGCICCSLRNDLIEQVLELVRTDRFDYLVIEASGVCDPLPIAQTLAGIPRLTAQSSHPAHCYLDNVVTVVDALRMVDEFEGGEKLMKQNSEDDIESLLIEQIEFCSTILLNKVDEVSPEQLEHIMAIIRTLQPEAPIIPCNYAKVDVASLINTSRFNLARVANSAGWVQQIRQLPEDTTEAQEHETGHYHHDDEHHHDHDDHHHHDDDHCDEEGHDGHHHHDHDDHCGIAGHGPHCHCHHHHGETAEYGIGSFVYYRRAPFDMNRFDYFVVSHWPKNIIRAKGICYFHNRMDMSFLFEQAGRQKQLSETGLWYAELDQDTINEMMENDPGFRHDWDPVYGDRMQKIVFIGQNMDREAIIAELDKCLVHDQDKMKD